MIDSTLEVPYGWPHCLTLIHRASDRLQMFLLNKCDEKNFLGLSIPVQVFQL